MGSSEVVLDEGLVVRNGTAVRLQPRVAGVLRALIARSGSLVSRDDLLKQVWPGSVVSDAALNRCINELRRAFGDSPSSPEYIETIPKRGYRLIAPVELHTDSHESSGAPPPQQGRFKLATPVLVGALAVIALGIGFIAADRMDGNAGEPVISVLVVLSDRVDEPGYSVPLERAFRVALSQSRVSHVVSADDMGEAIRRMQLPPGVELSQQDWIDLAQREGIEVVCILLLDRLNELRYLHARLIRGEDSKLLHEAQIELSDAASVIPSVQALAREMREALGESHATISKSKPLRAVTTANFEALRAYSAAETLRRADKGGEALPLLEYAISLDPEFAAAHAALALIHYGNHESRESAERHWGLALENSERLTESEYLYVSAHSAWYSDPQVMLARWKMLANLYPGDPSGHSNKGTVLRTYFNDHQGCAEAFQAALGVRPSDWLLHYKHGYCLLGLGETDKAVEAFELSYQIAGHLYNFGLVDAYLVAFRSDDAYELMYKDARRAPELSTPSKKAIAYFLDLGRIAQAFSELGAIPSTDSVPSLNHVPSKLALLAILIQQAPQQETAQFVCAQTESLVNLAAALDAYDDFSRVPQVAVMAKFAARYGCDQAAQSLLVNLRRALDSAELPTIGQYVDLVESEVLVAQGESTRAIAILERLVSQRNLYQARESLAFAYARHGDSGAALEQLDWMIRNRGAAFAEAMIGYGRSINISAWATAHLSAANLSLDRGNSDAARDYLSAILDHWSSADHDHRLSELARQKLNEIAKP
ncbi:MAG: winged helix-turn-helix domain-containing protein [Pseudomonadota bacterium]